MVTFSQWLLQEERNLVDPHVLDGYERAFQQQLESLIGRTKDPALRRAFEAMRGFRFTNYIVASLVRNGIHQRYNVEDALQRIVFSCLSPVGERGLPRQALFDIDQSRPYNVQTGNPLEARFKTFLNHELRTITMGRYPALRHVQYPNGLSISYRDPGFDPTYGTVSAEEIPGRAASYDYEMLDDLVDLLRHQSTPGLSLADLFLSILKGEGTRLQRSRFGHALADIGRKQIVQTIHKYAQKSQNWSLLGLLDRIQNPDTAKPVNRQQPPRPPKPNVSPDEQDYRSIVQVLERNGRSVSMAILGRDRRRWMEWPPRDPGSRQPNRLADVLARMVADGVLKKQGTRYVPGPNYARYLWTPEPPVSPFPLQDQ